MNQIETMGKYLFCISYWNHVLTPLKLSITFDCQFKTFGSEKNTQCTANHSSIMDKIKIQQQHTLRHGIFGSVSDV